MDLKLLIFNWRDIKNPQAGGAEVYTHEIMHRLAQKGAEITLFTSEYPGCKNIEEIDGITIIRKGKLPTTYYYARKYYKKHLKGKYDLIIDEINVIPWFTPLYAKEPIVGLVHEIGTWALPHHKEVNPIIRKTLPPLTPLLFKPYRKTPIITVSQSTKQDLQKLSIPPENIHIVPNAVDHNIYKPPPQKTTEDPIILYLGRITWYKNIHHILHALKYVKKHIPNIHLIIAGKPEKTYTKHLHKITKKLNLTKNVTYKYNVSLKEKIELLQKATLLVIPSSREGFGIVVLEANACATPVIGYDVPGLRDSIRHMETGILVPYGNIKAMTKAMVMLTEDQELWRKLAENALNWAKQFDWDKSTKRFIKVIEGAIHG